MAQYVDRFNAVTRVLHWILAAAFFVLIFSGLGLFSRAFFNYFDFFGGPERGILFHKWAGIIFFISSVLLFLNNVRETCSFDKDDRRWLKACGGYLSSEDKHIPQGKFNAGQKLFALFSFYRKRAEGDRPEV